MSIKSLHEDSARDCLQEPTHFRGFMRHCQVLPVPDTGAVSVQKAKLSIAAPFLGVIPRMAGGYWSKFEHGNYDSSFQVL